MSRQGTAHLVSSAVFKVPGKILLTTVWTFCRVRPIRAISRSHCVAQCHTMCSLDVMGRLLKSHAKRLALEPVAWKMRRREQSDKILMHDNNI